MTDAEQREAARQFINRWKGRGNEDEDGRSYWIELLHDVLGMEDVTQHVDFEKKVYVDGNKKRIDAYLPETKVIIEQKSLGKDLNQKIRNSGGIDLTPYEQAERYNNKLDYSEKARWIVTCNFAEIWIYDMNQVNAKDFEPMRIQLSELQDKYPMLDFLIKQDVRKVSHEMKVSIEAGNIVGKLYDAFAKEFGLPETAPKNETPEEKAQREADLRSLNALCVRLVFCLYAEDAGIFDRASFHDYVASFEPQRLRMALKELFKILDTPIEKRDRFLADDLAAFPYVNGGLFSDETLEIPPFTQELKDVLLIDASENFDWRDISPTIFGAVFESTLNPETRRKGGMHYTSIENIHKVIDPLFLDDLKSELEDVLNTKGNKKRINALKMYQQKLASLTFLDPACGSGNFLTETYLSLRKLENRVIQELIAIDSGVFGQIKMGESMVNPIKVLISQFYGIEINDFAVTVAKTALWIAESQMMQKTESIIKMELDFLPLTTNANIVEGNALRIDWNDVVSPDQLNYIMGNPPFSGARLMSKNQKEDVKAIFKKIKRIGNIDYVACWFKKAVNFIENTKIKAAFVSTNSITQGEQVSIIWKDLLDLGVKINFAYRTFRWDSEASIKAHVHCVIIGFSMTDEQKKKIFTTTYNRKEEHIEDKIVKNINAYLVDAPNILISNRSKPLCNVPQMSFGSMPNDNGFLSNYSTEQKDAIISKYPETKQFFRKFVGSTEFINNKQRWCLWFENVSPSVINKSNYFKETLSKVKEFRLSSKRKATQKLADTPNLFGEIRQPESQYLLIPRVSSERRRYVPIGFMKPDVIASDAVLVLPHVTFAEFGILESNVHMSWMRTVCGRLKSDYRYSVNIVYNNFPWPTPTEKQKALIEKTAQAILDARDLYPDSSLADLYDPLTMPQELRKAHQMNDRAVMQAYGFSTKMSESDCVAELMKMYQQLTAAETKKK
jgi:type I restriction-modification system DNA methylase subunit